MSMPTLTIILTVGIVCVSLVFTLVIVAASIAIPVYLMRSNQKKTEALMATGTPGEATILQLADTGMRINDNPRLSLLLEVRIPPYPPYQVQKTMTVPMIRMSQVQVGSVVAVMADPTQPNNPDKLGLLLR
jgi:hypothetical protein